MKHLPFVGREIEQQHFRQIILSSKHDNHNDTFFTNVVLIYGFGGMGKTTMCKKFREIAKIEFSEMTSIYIDWEAKTGYTYSPTELLDTIYNELKAYYAKELEPYLKHKKDIKSIQEEVDKILEKSKGMLDATQPIASTIATTTTGNPILGAPITGGFNILGTIIGNIEESRLKNKWGLKDDKFLSYENPELILADCMIECIEKITNSGTQKLLFILDTCEVIKLSEQWFINHFLVPMINKNNHVILIYSGRENTYNQRNITINDQTVLVKGFADKLTACTPFGIDMKLFSEVDIRKYLNQRLNMEVNEKVVQFIQKLSRGVPFAVDLLTNAIENIGVDSFLKQFNDKKFHSLIEFSDSNEQVIKNVTERFLYYCLQSENGKNDLIKIYSIAILREKNSEILKLIWQDSNPLDTLQNLQGKYSFFIGEAKLHDAFQSFIEEYILRNEILRGGIVKKIVDKALPIYQSIYEKENEKETDLRDRISEPRWRKATFNYLNCLSWSDADAAANFFLTRGIELLLFDVDFARDLKVIVDRLIKNELISNRIRKQVIIFSEAINSYRWYSFSEKLFSFCKEVLDEWHLDSTQKIILQIVVGRMKYLLNDFDGSLNVLSPIYNFPDLQKSIKEKLADTLNDVGEKFCLDKERNFYYSEIALSIFEKIIKLNNKRAAYFHRYAVMLRLGNKPKESIEYYLRATELNPKEEYLFKGLGFAYQDAKLYNEAIKIFEKLIEINPNSTINHNSIGNALIGLQYFDEAIVMFQKAIDLDPKNELPYINLADLLENLGRYDYATVLYDKLYKINNKNLNALWRKAGFHLNLNEFDTTIEECEKVLLMDSENSWTYVLLSMAYIGKGNSVKGKNLLDISLTKKTNWQGAFYGNVGYCYDELGEIENAIEFYIKGTENGSKNSHTGLGQIFLSQGNIEKAEEYLNVAIDKQTDNTNPLTSLALLHKLKQNSNESNRTFEMVIENAKQRPNINNQFNQVIAFAGLQNYDEASQLLKMLSSKFKISHLTVRKLFRDFDLLKKSANNSDELISLISEIEKLAITAN